MPTLESFTIENIKNWNRTPAELAAIMQHKYFLSIERSAEVTLEEATLDFMDRYMEAFRREQTRLHNQAQVQEIEKFRWLESERKGHDIGQETAAQTWREKYAALYRQECESLEKNGFQNLSVTVRNEKGIHVRPAGTLACLVKNYDAEVYVSKPDQMEHFNFLLKNRRYINFKSVMLNLLLLCAAQGDTLEFISYGREAKEVLAEIKALVESGFGEFHPARP